MAIRTFHPFSLLLAAALLPACAHTANSGEYHPAKDTAAISTTSSTDSKKAEELDAAEVGRLFLGLLKGLESRDALTKERVEATIGRPLIQQPGGILQGYVGDLGQGWQYAFSFYPKTLSTKNGISLDFILGDERFPDMKPVCSLNFEHYHNALKKMGYRPVQILGEIGQLQEWRYYKDDIVISIDPESKYFEVDNTVSPTCIRSISTLN